MSAVPVFFSSAPSSALAMVYGGMALGSSCWLGLMRLSAGAYLSCSAIYCRSYSACCSSAYLCCMSYWCSYQLSTQCTLPSASYLRRPESRSLIKSLSRETTLSAFALWALTCLSSSSMRASFAVISRWRCASNYISSFMVYLDRRRFADAFSKLWLFPLHTIPKNKEIILVFRKFLPDTITYH